MSADEPLYDVSELYVQDFYGFYPSLALGIVALVLFTLAAVAVQVLTHITRRWYMVLARCSPRHAEGGLPL